MHAELVCSYFLALVSIKEGWEFRSNFNVVLNQMKRRRIRFVKGLIDQRVSHNVNTWFWYNSFSEFKNTEFAEFLVTITCNAKWIIDVCKQDFVVNFFSVTLLVRKQIKDHFIDILPNHSFLIKVDSCVSFKIISDLQEILLIISIINEERCKNIASMKTLNHLSRWIA